MAGCNERSDLVAAKVDCGTTRDYIGIPITWHHNASAANHMLGLEVWMWSDVTRSDLKCGRGPT